MSEQPLDTEPDLNPASDVSAIMSQRQVDTRGRNVRQHAARGTMINSAFQVGLAGIGLLRRLMIAAFLTQAEFGIWGILVSTLVTLSWLKQVGIADKYIQQSEPDQEAAYQKAFTLEFLVSILFFILIVALLPLYAVAYGRTELILPGIVLGATVPLSAFETPTWIAYRRMQFVRQRVLTAIDPLVAFAVTLALAVLGAGYWSLVIGAVAGTIAGGLAATLTSPYPLRLRFERKTLNDYTRFSWPLMGFGLSNLISVQGALLIANRSVGLAGVATIGLVVSISSFADRVDGIVSQTIYPVVAAVAHRVDLLQEAFVKSNRLVLMWAIPFGFGLALFAGDLITFVYGERWRGAENLLAAFGVIVGFTQVAFNWSIFMRAVNNTKPIFFASLVSLAVFGVVTVPALLTMGLTGYAIGIATSVAAQIFVRGYFLNQLFHSFRLLRHLARSIAPTVPAVAVVLLVRLLDNADRSLERALAELALYAIATILLTLLFERRLIAELAGYVRGSGGGRMAAWQHPTAEPGGSPSPRG